MFLRVGVPLIIVAVLALIVLLGVVIYRRRRKEFEEERDLAAELAWNGLCPVENPETGASCQREEFHTTHHYRVVNDTMVTWA